MNSQKTTRRQLVAGSVCVVAGHMLAQPEAAVAGEYSESTQTAVKDFINLISKDHTNAAKDVLQLQFDKALGRLIGELARECGIDNRQSAKSASISETLDSVNLKRVGKWYREKVETFE